MDKVSAEKDHLPLDPLMHYSWWVIKNRRYKDSLDRPPTDGCWIYCDVELISDIKRFLTDRCPVDADSLINRHPTGDENCGNWETAAAIEAFAYVNETAISIYMELFKKYPLYADDIPYIFPVKESVN